MPSRQDLYWVWNTLVKDFSLHDGDDDVPFSGPSKRRLAKEHGVEDYACCPDIALLAILLADDLRGE